MCIVSAMHMFMQSKTRWPLDSGKFDQVLGQTKEKLLAKSLRMKRGSRAGGLKVKTLRWTLRDAGLSTAWHYTFLLHNSL